MARTWRDLITDSLRLTGVLGEGATPNNARISTGLLEVQNLLAMLDLKKLYPFTEVTNTGTLVSGQEFYTVGVGADIDTPRPNSIITFAVNFGGVYRPLKKETTIAFDDESRVLAFGSIPHTFVYRTEFPFGKIQIYPIPSGSYTFSMTSNFKQLEVGMNDEVLLPSGYYPLLQYNLALLLLVHYPNPAKFPMIKDVADRILGDMMRQNSKVGKLKNDFGNSSGKYDIYSDSYTR